MGSPFSVVVAEIVMQNIEEQATVTLKMTTAQVVETSVTVTNSSFQKYTHPDDHKRQTTDTPGFKPFTINRVNMAPYSLELLPFNGVIKPLSMTRPTNDECMVIF